METLDELKAIIDKAPEGATHYDSMATWKYKNLDRGTFLMPDGTGYKIDEFYPNKALRSLSDIERIIELMELNKDTHTIVSGYLCGDEWEHWQEFNAGKFKL